MEFVACTWGQLTSKYAASSFHKGNQKEKANSRKKCEMPVYRKKCVAYISGHSAFGKYLRTSFLIAHVSFWFSCCFAGFFFSSFSLLPFPFVFFPHSLLGLLPIALLAQMMQKNHINGSRAPFWHFACCALETKKKKNALTFSHLAGQLKRHNACTAASQVVNLANVQRHL